MLELMLVEQTLYCSLGAWVLLTPQLLRIRSRQQLPHEFTGRSFWVCQ